MQFVKQRQYVAELYISLKLFFSDIFNEAYAARRTLLRSWYLLTAHMQWMIVDRSPLHAMRQLVRVNF